MPYNNGCVKGKDGVRRIPVTPDYILGLVFDTFQNKFATPECKAVTELYYSMSPADNNVEAAMAYDYRMKRYHHRKYIFIFKNMYKEKYGAEPTMTIKPEHVSMIKNIIKRLEEKNMDIEDYLKFFFEFNSEILKSLPYSVSNYMWDEFAAGRHDDILSKQVEADRNAEKIRVVKLARQMLKQTGNARLKEDLKSYQVGRMNISSFRRTLSKISREMRKKGVKK